MRPGAVPQAAWQQRDNGSLILRVRLTPKSAADAIGGIETLSDGTSVLKIRVRAVPQDGEANQALIRVLAKALAIGVSSIQIETGATARVKLLVLTGDASDLATRLTQLCAQGT